MTTSEKTIAVERQNVIRDSVLKEQLVTRKQKLELSLTAGTRSDHLTDLLRQVDEALHRMEDGTFGICETCHETIENDRILVDPLLRNCLDHLSPVEQRALERDLDLAYQIQNGLLPKSPMRVSGWETAFHYEAAGPVSGDYCDLIPDPFDPEAFYFLVGDVSGKGVAASLLMSNLHAIFRSLVQLQLPVHQLLERANRIFCEGTLTTYFATLVGGRAGRDGTIELSNAGHCLPLIVRPDSVTSIPSTGLPLGIACDSVYTDRKFSLANGESLFIYSDGLTESRNGNQVEYGEDRLHTHLKRVAANLPGEIIQRSVEDLSTFLAGVRKADDLTMMVLRQTAS